MLNKILIAASLLIVFVACAQNRRQSSETNVEYRRITASEARKMLDENPNIIILDVRTPEEFKEERIAGAILLPIAEIKDRAATVLPDKDAIILVHCRLGRRSEESARMLIELGYTNVYDFGGLADWKYETISGPE